MTKISKQAVVLTSSLTNASEKVKFSIKLVENRTLHHCDTNDCY